MIMSDIAKSVGQRIRNYRTQLGWSQEKLAELSGCHPTYIGQLERGEKNATLTTLESISIALNVPLERFVEYITPGKAAEESVPNQCYNLILEQTPRTQRRLRLILDDLVKLYGPNP